MLKRIHAGTTLLAGIALLASACPSSLGQGLFAVSGAANAASTLYRLDPTNGAVLQTIGSTGFTHVTALAFDPTTGALYGHVTDGSQQLISINPLTGAGTIIGSTGQTVPDMSFNSSGQLFAWSEDGDVLESINKATGVATQVGSHNVNTFQTGLAFNSAGTLYLKPNNNLYTVDTTTGVGTFVESLSASLYNSLAFDASDNLFSVDRNGSTSFLDSIDIATGNVTQLGDIGVVGISALAFQSGVKAADTPEPGSVALLVGMGAATFTVLRRRRKSSRAA